MTFTLSPEDTSQSSQNRNQFFTILESVEDIEHSEARLKKLLSGEEFAIRWGFAGRKEGEGKERFRKHPPHPKLESEKQYAMFRDAWEEFVHPPIYWGLEEDETWDGIGEDDVQVWYEEMIHEIYHQFIDRPEQYIASLSPEKVERICLKIHEKVVQTKSNHNLGGRRYDQLSSLPREFSSTLWGDILEASNLFVALLQMGHSPSVSTRLQQEHVSKFSPDALHFYHQPYSPLDEVFADWDPEKQSYWDDNCPAVTKEFQKKRQASRADITSVNGTIHISRRKLYKTLLADVRQYLTKNNERLGLSQKAKNDTEHYLEYGTVVLALMRRIEAKWQEWYGDYMLFTDGLGPTGEEERMMRLIESVRGPIPGNDDETTSLSVITTEASHTGAKKRIG